MTNAPRHDADAAGDGDPLRPTYLDGLTPTQERAVLALLTEPSVAKAAEKAEIAPRSLFRWLDEDRFARAYQAARRAAFAQAISLTQRYAPMAVQSLAKIVNDPVSAASARVSAAQALLRFARESIELDDLAERVKALEQASVVKPRGR